MNVDTGQTCLIYDVHVTWWGRDWPAENWCVVTWREMQTFDLFIPSDLSWLFMFFLHYTPEFSHPSRLRLPELCPNQVIVSSSWKRSKRSVHSSSYCTLSSLTPLTLLKNILKHLCFPFCNYCFLKSFTIICDTWSI